ncbi:TIR domain-containing protein [uncultured Thiothrix sp.]|uniref:TIR domain-containing protein n=1 Tax=uncultured Thiothrix sp. TaxID=223185 RepID=UPI0026086E74|nr:TIR domain-containing protein [uncultured Thiothrix sp.]HMT94361.1 TIR domain-containing protein [Thiolinea sp.]
MSDIFISYSRQDSEYAQKFTYLLEWYGYSVWRDTNSLHGGQDFSLEIQQAIKLAKCTIVLWSQSSIDSKWVRAEAALADSCLLPVRLKVVEIPPPFNTLHTEDLSNWQGDPCDSSFQRLLTAIKRLCSSPYNLPYSSLNFSQQSSGLKKTNKVLFNVAILLAMLVGIGVVLLYQRYLGSAVDTLTTSLFKSNRYIDHGNGAITDTKTNLMWKKCSEGLKGENCTGFATKYTVQDALINFRGTISFAGYDDWRLPTREELHSLVFCSNGVIVSEIGNKTYDGCGETEEANKKYQKPTINIQSFPNTPALYSWSGEQREIEGKIYYWATDFGVGLSQMILNTELKYPVRLVRSLD